MNATIEVSIVNIKHTFQLQYYRNTRSALNQNFRLAHINHININSVSTPWVFKAKQSFPWGIVNTTSYWP